MIRKPQQAPNALTAPSDWVLCKFWRVTRAYWLGEQRWSALAMLGAIVALAGANVYSMVALNEAGGRFFNSIQARSAPDFYAAMFRIAMFLLFQLLSIVLQAALSQWLAARWRRWLTSEFTKHWLDLRAFYRLRLNDSAGNADQRIAEDLRLLTSGALTLSIGLITSIITVAAFAGVLWGVSGSLPLTIAGQSISIPGYMFWAALLYWLMGSAFGFIVGSPLIRLNNRQQGLEADFRFSLMRVREKAEGIALYGGESQEQARTGRVFSLLYANYLRIVRQNAKLLSFQTFLTSAPQILPYLVIVPRYFSGALQFGDVMRIGNGFGQISQALSWLVTSYGPYAEWHATVDRLAEFQGESHRLFVQPSGIDMQASSDGSYSLEGITASLETGAPVVSNVSLNLKPGERVLIKGVSGAGKSTLFSVMAGLWPWGFGMISVPPAVKSLFLPQKPYVPIGPLRGALRFPAGTEAASDAVHEDEALRSALMAVGLDRLVGRLDDEDHWEQVLSPGELQRLAIAQSILAQPDWLFLDEATSALDEGQEAKVYEMLGTLLPHTTIVSIGHRRSIERFHSRVVVIGSLTGGGTSTAMVS